MARITAEEKRLTPVYFQTRRESKYTIPNIALPSDKDRVLANLEDWYYGYEGSTDNGNV